MTKMKALAAWWGREPMVTGQEVGTSCGARGAYHEGSDTVTGVDAPPLCSSLALLKSVRLFICAGWSCCVHTVDLPAHNMLLHTN